MAGSTTQGSTKGSTKGKGQGSAAKAPGGALHPNPRIAAALAAGDRDKYGSAAAWLRAHGINDKATQRTARQVLRDAGMGVGRGNRYTGTVGVAAAKAAKANAQQRAKASKATASK